MKNEVTADKTMRNLSKIMMSDRDLVPIFYIIILLSNIIMNRYYLFTL